MVQTYTYSFYPFDNRLYTFQNAIGHIFHLHYIVSAILAFNPMIRLVTKKMGEDKSYFLFDDR